MRLPDIAIGKCQEINVKIKSKVSLIKTTSWTNMYLFFYDFYCCCKAIKNTSDCSPLLHRMTFSCSLFWTHPLLTVLLCWKHTALQYIISRTMRPLVWFGSRWLWTATTLMIFNSYMVTTNAFIVTHRKSSDRINSIWFWVE